VKCGDVFAVVVKEKAKKCGKNPLQVNYSVQSLFFPHDLDNVFILIHIHRRKDGGDHGRASFYVPLRLLKAFYKEFPARLVGECILVDPPHGGVDVG